MYEERRIPVSHFFDGLVTITGWNESKTAEITRFWAE